MSRLPEPVERGLADYLAAKALESLKEDPEVAAELHFEPPDLRKWLLESGEAALDELRVSQSALRRALRPLWPQAKQVAEKAARRLMPEEFEREKEP